MELTTNKQFKQAIKEYNKYNEQKKKYDKDRKAIGKLIQLYMEKNNIQNYEDEEYKVTKVTSSSGKKVDEEKLLEILKENNVPAIKETADLEKLEKLLDENKVDTKIIPDILSCITEKKYSYIKSSRI